MAIEGLFSLGVLVGLPVACELGHWLGRRDGSMQSPTELAHTRTWQRAVLGLAGLFMGFTFALATARFDRAEAAHGTVSLILVVLAVLVASSAVAMASLGYTRGLEGKRLRLGMLVIPLLVGALIVRAC